MKLSELMTQKQEPLCGRWLQAILAEYGEKAATAWRLNKDPFTNPVGHAFRTEAPKLVEWSARGGEVAEAASALEPILRIRAIQDLSASQAVGFVFKLRELVRAELASELAGGALDAELAALDRQVEAMGMVAFDVYVACRERFYNVRVNELKRSVAMLVRRYGLTDPAEAASPPAPAASHPGGDR